MNIDGFQNHLACQGCGTQPDYSNPPHSLSNVWIAEGEDDIHDVYRMHCVCTECAAFYRLSPDWRVAPLTSYTRTDFDTRLNDVVFAESFLSCDVNTAQIVGRYIIATEDATRLAQEAERAERLAQEAERTARLRQELKQIVETRQQQEAARLAQEIEQPSTRRTSSSRRPLPPGLRYAILQRDGFRCKACGRSPEQHGVVLHVDHIVAVAKGGTNEPSNLRALCAECNFGKGDR